MRVVIDPNVLVSAVITDGVSARLIDRWLTDRSFELVACHTLFEELRDVLSRPRFRRWVSIEQATLFIDLLEAEAEDWPDPSDPPAVTDDPKDDYLVALLKDSGAHMIVSGDGDLLNAQAALRITVSTPGDFLTSLEPPHM